MSWGTINIVESFLNIYVSLFVLLVIVQIVLSWIRLPYSVWSYRVRGFIDETVNPFLRLFRRILPMFGPIDLSPMIGIFSLLVLKSIVFAVLESFAR